MAYVIYKGKRVSPMELKMIMEREKREGVEPGKIQRVSEAKKKKKEKPVEEPRPTIEREIPPHMEPSLKLDFEDYPYPTPGPTPGWVEGVQTRWLQYEMAMGKPSQALREKAAGKLSEAEEAKLRGEDVKAGLLFSESMLIRSGAALWEGFTLPFRPLASSRTLNQLFQLLSTHKGIGEAIEYIKTDPGIISEIAGGFLGGSLLADIGRITGISKPKGYTLKEKQVPITETTPATLMPKGKYPKGWGGTAVTILKDRPEYISIWEPTPIYHPSEMPYISGILSGVKGLKNITELGGGPIKTEPIKIKETIIEPEKIIKPIGHRRPFREPSPPFIEPRPEEREEEITITLPGYIPRPDIDIDIITRTTTDTIQETKPIQIQTQRIIQIPSVPTISTPRFERLTREIAITRPPIRRKKAKKQPWDILTVGEFREYRVKMPKELLKGLG